MAGGLRWTRGNSSWKTDAGVTRASWQLGVSKKWIEVADIADKKK